MSKDMIWEMRAKAARLFFTGWNELVEIFHYLFETTNGPIIKRKCV